MLTHKQNKETRFKARLKAKMKEKRLEHIPQNKSSFSMMLTFSLSQIYSQPNKND